MLVRGHLKEYLKKIRLVVMVKKVWNFSVQLVFLIVIYQLSNVAVHHLQLKIPGNVVGILLLFLLLYTGIIKIEKIEFASGWLLKHFGFFFIPISVGLMTIGDVFVSHGLAILFVLLVSTIFGLVASSSAAQVFISKKEKEALKYHDHAL